jgi:hypothetical protein
VELNILDPKWFDGNDGHKILLYIKEDWVKNYSVK